MGPGRTPAARRRSPSRRRRRRCCCAANGRARGSLRWRIPLDRPPSIGVEIALTLAVLLGAAAFGAARGGQSRRFRRAPRRPRRCRRAHARLRRRRRHGLRRDPSRASRGFCRSPASAPRTSLPFFDVAAARARLEADPLVKQASVRKLYPNQIVVDIVERTPYGVWQKDGEVHAIAADGGADRRRA